MSKEENTGCFETWLGIVIFSIIMISLLSETEQLKELHTARAPIPALPDVHDTLPAEPLNGLRRHAILERPTKEQRLALLTIAFYCILVIADLHRTKPTRRRVLVGGMHIASADFLQ